MPLEYLNLDSLEVRLNSTSVTSLDDYFRHIIKYRTDPLSGILAIKLFARFAISLRQTHPYTFNSLISSSNILMLKRRDVLAQAVSLARAKQTGRWFANRNEQSHCSYDRNLISSCVRYINLNNNWWDAFATESGNRSKTIYYEDIINYAYKDVKDVASWLGLGEAIVREGHPVFPTRQSDDVNNSWIIRYLEEEHGAPG